MMPALQSPAKKAQSPSREHESQARWELRDLLLESSGPNSLTINPWARDMGKAYIPQGDGAAHVMSC
jgi:hypothetical protein